MAYRHLLNFWPLVPAVDIQTIHEAIKTSDQNCGDSCFNVPFSELQEKRSLMNIPKPDEKQSMNILIVGDGVASLIKTVARMYRHNTTDLKIYVTTHFTESFVRDLLLLSLLSEASSNIGILEKSEIFLEIFGNTFLRASTSTFVETMSSEILEDISSTRQSVKVPMVSMHFMKQKEIDEMCKVFKYLKDSEFVYDVGKAWENSLRSYFGTRYDNRANLFDYHFNMRLSQYPIINLKKYLNWRETGIAFQLRKARFDKANKTLCVNSSAKPKSSEYFLGDIATSPYIAFGVECENDEMLKKVNNQFIYTSEDVSKFNVTEFITEFTSREYSDILKRVMVYFICYSTFCKSQQFQDFFDAVYITCDMMDWAERDQLSKILNKNGVVMFETINNVVNSTKDQKIKHANDIQRLATKNNLMLSKFLTSYSDNLKIYVSNEKTHIK